MPNLTFIKSLQAKAHYVMCRCRVRALRGAEIRIEHVRQAESDITNLIEQAHNDAVSKIYSIANDLANKDPNAVGSVSLAPYFANAVAIYQEFLKGDDYERIDWKSLKLPTLERYADE